MHGIVRQWVTMYGYARLCTAVYGMAMHGYVRLCTVMYGYAQLCMAMSGH